ncbi:hypothetical protein CR513_18670, partial [Mucuna pruriens]
MSELAPAVDIGCTTVGTPHLNRKCKVLTRQCSDLESSKGNGSTNVVVRIRVIPSSTTIAMVDGGGSPLIALRLPNLRPVLLDRENTNAVSCTTVNKDESELILNVFPCCLLPVNSYKCVESLRQYDHGSGESLNDSFSHSYIHTRIDISAVLDVEQPVFDIKHVVGNAKGMSQSVHQIICASTNKVVGCHVLSDGKLLAKRCFNKKVSFIEILKEEVRDLLDPSFMSKSETANGHSGKMTLGEAVPELGKDPNSRKNGSPLELLSALHPSPILSKEEHPAGIRRELEKIEMNGEDLCLPIAPNKLDTVDRGGDKNDVKSRACIFKLGDDCRRDDFLPTRARLRPVESTSSSKRKQQHQQPKTQQQKETTIAATKTNHSTSKRKQQQQLAEKQQHQQPAEKQQQERKNENWNSGWNSGTIEVGIQDSNSDNHGLPCKRCVASMGTRSQTTLSSQLSRYDVKIMISSSLTVESDWKFDNSSRKELHCQIIGMNFKGLLSGMDIKFDDEILGLLLLNSLPKSWDTFKKHHFLWKKEKKGKKGKSKEKDDDRVTTATSDDLVILQDFASVNLVSDESMWIIDSGATLHEALGLYFEVKGPSVREFKHFQILVKRQSGKKVKCIHFDNGGEYCGPFDVYCKQQGIRHEKTPPKIPPKTPQLNGLAERMNRTLIERVRCMLSEAKLPKHFWGETLYTTVHAINLSPTVALDIEMPDKIWFGKDVKSCDVQFMEDQTIEDIDKNDGFDVPLDDDVEEEQEMSQDENQDGEEPECYQESIESKKRKKAWQSKLFKHVDLRYHCIRDALDAKLLELTKVHTDDNGANMMTKAVLIRKFEACREIVGLTITST